MISLVGPSVHVILTDENEAGKEDPLDLDTDSQQWKGKRIEVPETGRRHQVKP